MHSHYFPLSVLDRLPDGPAAIVEAADGRRRLSAGGHAIPLGSDLFDLERQREAMQRQGLTHRTLIPPPFCLLYELPEDQGANWSSTLNDEMAAAAGRYPDSFTGFATVPLQSPDAAIVEMERAVGELGLRGVEIATTINGVSLDHHTLDPFWYRCQKLSLPVLIHPHYIAGAERMGPYHLRNLVGNPSETALAGAHLLFGGVLERFPDLCLILSHGGGALPHLIGRLQHGFTVRRECQGKTTDLAGQLRRLYYDSVVFDPLLLRHLIELVGASQVVLGTDYPFDMSEPDPIGFVRNSGLPEADIELILHSGDRLLGDAG